MKNASRRMLFALLALLWAPPAFAQNYPSKPVTIVVPFAPGGSVDAVGKIISDGLHEELGQPFVLDYRSGANSRIGTTHVANAAPDGYTLLMVSGSFFLNPSTYKNLPYDPIEGFESVGMVAQNANVLTVGSETGVNTLQELIDLAKSRPGDLNFGSSGLGGSNHIAGELFKMKAGVDMVHVPYRGSGALFPDLIGGVVDLAIVSVPSGMPFIKSGQLKALAVTAEKRAGNLPDVPTMKELGVDLVTSVPYGLVAPAGTPAEVVETLNKAVQAAVATQKVRERFALIDLEPMPGTSAEMDAFTKSEIALNQEVVKQAGIEPQE